MSGLSDEEYEALAADAQDELRRPEGELRNLEARLELEPLMREADRFGIDIPAEWYNEPNNPFALPPGNRRRLKRLVSQTRFDWWKARAELLITVLSACQ